MKTSINLILFFLATFLFLGCKDNAAEPDPVPDAEETGVVVEAKDFPARQYLNLSQTENSQLQALNSSLFHLTQLLFEAKSDNISQNNIAISSLSISQVLTLLANSCDDENALKISAELGAVAGGRYCL